MSNEERQEPEDATKREEDVAERDEDAPSAEFAQALEAYERDSGKGAPASTDIQPGMQVQGKIVAAGDEWLTIDFGGRSEAVAKAQPFRNEDGTLRVAIGDTLEMFVVESGDQIVLATSLHTEGQEASQRLRDAKAAGAPVTGKVTGVNAGGLEVQLGGLRGFCPMSQIELGFCEDPTIYVGRSMEFLVTSVEEGRGNAILSRKKLLRREEHANAKKMLAKLKAGDEIDGVVARMEPFGAFVDLGGVDGLVHVSEIRHERIGHPNEVLKQGEKVRVKVLRIEKDKKGRTRIGLSIKACAPDPWEAVAARFPSGTRVSGTVARLTDFGAFVTLAPGIDGLIHVSQAADHRVEHVREVLKPGQEVEVYVLNVDAGRHRVSLSMREPAAASKATLDVPPARQRSPRKGGGHEKPPAKKEPEELTTMAIALRKAMEKAKRKE